MTEDEEYEKLTYADVGLDEALYENQLKVHPDQNNPHTFVPDAITARHCSTCWPTRRRVGHPDPWVGS